MLLCSVLLKQAVQAEFRLKQWLAEHECESVRQLKGGVSQQHALDPIALIMCKRWIAILSPAGVLSQP
jgi:hypothetical protein